MTDEQKTADRERLAEMLRGIAVSGSSNADPTGRVRAAIAWAVVNKCLNDGERRVLMHMLRTTES